MRKLVAILLITLLSVTLLGYHLVFSFQLASVKSQMKAFLRNQKAHKDVAVISLSKEESGKLYWEDENEFRYKGEMYDVIEKKTEGNKIFICCVSDKKETALLNEYQKNNKRNTSNSSIVQLVTTAFVLPADESLRTPERIVDNYFKDYSFHLQNTASTVLLPPPDVC